MPRTKKSADSASETQKVTVDIGKPNHSVEEIKEMFSSNAEFSQMNFKKAQEALKKYVDPNSSSSLSSMNTYTREMIRDYLKKPANNEENLRKVAKYLFYRSQILYRLVHWYAGMWDLRCRNVEPIYDLTTGLDSNVLQSYNETINQLDIYNLQETMYEVLVNCYLYDTCYFLWLRDDTGAMPFILDPNECKVTGRYSTGNLGFAIDMSKWSGKAKQNIIEWIGSPLKEMFNEYKRTGVKWVQVPDEYAGCFKFNIHDLFISIPPFAPLFQQLSTLLDTEDLAAIQSKLDVFKLIVFPIKTIGKVMNDWEIDPDLALAYLEKMVLNALPDYITAAPILGDGVDTIDFSNASTDAQVDRVANNQKNILNTSGGGALLSASMITSNIAFKTWLAEETEFAISSLIGQIDGFTNMMLGFDVANPCKVKHFEISVYTKEEFRSSLLEACQYSYSYRLSLGTLYGISEKQTLASLHFEQDFLGLQNLMVHPLQSSYTSTGETTEGTDPINGGRPQTDDSELTDSGERSRNK